MDKREEKSARQSPRPGRAATRWAVRFACLTGALFVIALLLIHLPRTQALVLDSLTHRIESETGVNITCKGFWWVPFSGLHVRDLHVRAAGRSVLECREASFNFVFSFARPWLVLDSVSLDNPVLHLQKVDGKFMVFAKAAGQGGAAAGRMSPEGAGGGFLPTPAHVLNIKIRSGMILAEQNGARVLEVKGVDGSLSVKNDGEVKAPFLNLDPFKNRG